MEVVAMFRGNPKRGSYSTFCSTIWCTKKIPIHIAMPTPTVVSPDTIPSLSHAFSAVGCNSIHSYEQGGLQSDCNPFSDLDVGTGRWVILLHASGLNEILDIDVKKFVEFLLSVSFILTTSYSMTEMFWSA